MAIVLALGSALVFGVADFLGGVAARRTATWTVVVGSQLCGLLALVLCLPFLPDATVASTDLWWGAAAGLAGVFGLTQFFRGFAIGSMSVVAPVSAVVSGAVPVVVGVVMGERPAALAWLGIAIALPAIVMISRERDDGTGNGPKVVTAALAAGAGFGLFYVLLDRTGHDAGIFPLVAARIASVTMLGLIGGVTARLQRSTGRIAGVIAASGVLDVTANVLFLYAVRNGLLALGAVIAAMYPASTIVLARFVLHERLQRIQLAGLGAAAGAVALVALA